MIYIETTLTPVLGDDRLVNVSPICHSVGDTSITSFSPLFEDHDRACSFLVDSYCTPIATQRA